MTKEEILHLGNLARIKLSDDETTRLQAEISDILDYVDVLGELVADKELTKKVGPVHNVFREDVVTNEPGEFTKDIVAAFPDKKGNHLKVKKILNPDS